LRPYDEAESTLKTIHVELMEESSSIEIIQTLLAVFRQSFTRMASNTKELLARKALINQFAARYSDRRLF